MLPMILVVNTGDQSGFRVKVQASAPMTLTPSDTRELFARECDFPTDRRSVIEAVGDHAITAPTGDETNVETVLDRSEESTYASVSELHSTVMGNLPDDYVGRKFYDDRSSSLHQDTERSL